MTDTFSLEEPKEYDVSGKCGAGGMFRERPVLDKGFVRLVDLMGDDYRVLQTARVSTGSAPIKGEAKDRGLIRYLYKNEHLTPFESVVLTFHVKAPIFVARQWFRHRTMSFNEASARYKELTSEYYYPDEWRLQDTKNKQGSDGTADELSKEGRDQWLEDNYEESSIFYASALHDGVAREQARITMPVGQYTEYYFTVNLRNLFHFLSLRADDHAQWEIRQYAYKIINILQDVGGLQWSLSAFLEFDELDKLLKGAINTVKETSELRDLLKKFIKENDNV